MATSRRVFSLFCLAVGAMEWVTVGTAAGSPHIFTNPDIRSDAIQDVPVMDPEQILPELYKAESSAKWFEESITQFVVMSGRVAEDNTQTFEEYWRSSVTRQRSIIGLEKFAYMYPVLVARGALLPNEDTNEGTNNERTGEELYFLEYFVFVHSKVRNTGLILQHDPFKDILLKALKKTQMLNPYAGFCYDLANSDELRNQYDGKLSLHTEKFVTQYDKDMTREDESGDPIPTAQTVLMAGTEIIKQGMTEWKAGLGIVRMMYRAKALGDHVLVTQGRMTLENDNAWQAEFLKIIVFKDTNEITRETMIVGQWE